MFTLKIYMEIFLDEYTKKTLHNTLRNLVRESSQNCLKQTI